LSFFRREPFATVTFDEKTKVIKYGLPKSEFKIDTVPKRQERFHLSFSFAPL
jgi:hypothetical protein